MPFKFTKKLTLLTSQELWIANCRNMRTEGLQSSHNQLVAGRCATWFWDCATRGDGQNLILKFLGKFESTVAAHVVIDYL